MTIQLNPVSLLIQLACLWLLTLSIYSATPTPHPPKKLPLHSLHSALWGFLSFGVAVGGAGHVIDVSHVTDRMCKNM